MDPVKFFFPSFSLCHRRGGSDQGSISVQGWETHGTRECFLLHYPQGLVRVTSFIWICRAVCLLLPRQTPVCLALGLQGGRRQVGMRFRVHGTLGDHLDQLTLSLPCDLCWEQSVSMLDFPFAHRYLRGACSKGRLIWLTVSDHQWFHCFGP